MINLILRWAFDYVWNSGVLKTTTASAVGSAAVVVGLGQYQVTEIENKFITERNAIQQYVDKKHVEAITSIRYINQRQDDIFLKMESIDKKLWDLIKSERE